MIKTSDAISCDHPHYKNNRIDMRKQWIRVPDKRPFEDMQIFSETGSFYFSDKTQNNKR